MTETDREALIGFSLGAAFGLLIVGVFILFTVTLGSSNLAPKEKFEVIDQYENCKVVRYLLENKADYVYFLDCREVR